MISAELAFDSDILDAVQSAISQSPKTMNLLINRSLLPTIRKHALELLHDTPGRVIYPIEWKSLKQRRAYFASRGFGHGIPYQRTGALLNAWDVIFTPFGEIAGSLSAINTNPAARWVIGADQQPFHHNTGWYVTNEKIPAINAYANDALIDAWYSVAGFEYT